MRRRRRSLVLVPAALLSAACTRTRTDDTVAGDALSRDLTLATQMENKPVNPTGAESPSNGGVCAAQPRPAAPNAARRQEAVALAQRAQQAEVVGDTRTARELFARAAQLDATDKDVVYHLARADEALGRTGDAAREYCQYLSLVPGTAGAAEANARLASLGAAKSGSGAGAAVKSATTTRVAWRSPAPARMRVSPVASSPSSTTTIAAARSARSGEVVASMGSDAGRTTTSGSVGEASGHRVAGGGAGGADGASAGDVSGDGSVGSVAQTTASSRSVPDAPPAPRQPQQQQQGHVARDAAIGAAAGAAVGGIMTHSVKGAGIGAIAGGLLGAVTGRAGSGGFRTPGYAR